MNGCKMKLKQYFETNEIILDQINTDENKKKINTQWRFIICRPEMILYFMLLFCHMLFHM